MKKLILLFTIIILATTSGITQVAINQTGAVADPSSILDISSTDKGLLIPRVTTTQRSAIGTTQTGLLVYDTDTESFWYYDNTKATWVEIVVDGVMGIDGLSDAKTDTRSVFLGVGAGTNDDGTNNNTGIGINVLNMNSYGIDNTSVGYLSSQKNTGGSYNVAIGFSALLENTTGIKNTSIGTSANHYNQTGNNNTAIGYKSGMGISTHSKSGNIFLGYMAGYYETGDNKLYIENSSSSTPLIGGDFSTSEIYLNGSVKITGGSPGIGKILTSDADGVASWEDNSAAGEINDLSDGKTDANSLFLGEASGAADDGSNYNTGVGFNSLNATTSGQHNTSLGYKSMLLNTSGYDNVGLGYFALPSNTTGIKNVGVGSSSLYWNTSGYNNIAIGYNSLNRNGTGISNVAIGTEALYNNTTKSNLVAVGDSALFNNGNSNPTSTQAILNTAVGSKAMLNNTTGYNNTAMGSSSLYSNTTGYHNVGIGYASLEDNADGDYNTAIGSFASAINTSGSNNVNLGYAADYFNNGGSNNVILGVHAGRGTSGNNKSGNIFIGYKAGYTETGSNKLYIDNSDDTTPLIGGDFSVDELYFNTTKMGVGTNNPNELLEIAHPTNDYGRMIVSDGGGSSRNALLFVSPKVSSQEARIEAYNYGSSSGVKLKFNTTGEGDCVFGGNVGIGTTSPLNHLHVMGSSTLATVLISPTGTANNDSELILAEDDNFTYGMSIKYDGGDNRMYIYGKNSADTLGSHLTIERGGNIGIGTQTPIGNFQIHDPNNQHNIMYITPKSTTGDSSSVFFAEDDDASTGMYWMYDGTGNRMGLWGKTSYGGPYGPHMLINRNSGDMAIGGENFATGYKLSVEGKVICEEVRVSLQADWPDYVFEENYNLMPIVDLKNFINTNGHLPNIPPAEKLESSGIEIGEMQRLLLEKVEELSLYIIEQEARIEKLQTKIDKLDN
ncbi:MAG: hypothetical protein HQ521_17420 [Bacteroidetes bacterium]|nr:hypothetical protein [Bacteroidota bacterium]